MNGIDGAALAAAARAATTRFRRRPGGIGRYAWAISLAIHAIVLLGAYLAVRYYLGQPVSAPQRLEPDASAVKSLIVNADATDAVHGGWAGIVLGGESSARDQSDANREIPSSIAREPRTFGMLSHLLPEAGVTDWAAAHGSVAGPRASSRRRTNPGGSSVPPQ